MELDFSDLHLKSASSLVYGAVFLALLALGALGWGLTPQHDAEPGFLTWTEWQVFKSARAYRAELTRLEQETDALAEMLTQTPDPVRAQLTVTRLTRELATGAPVLAVARATVLGAALTVQDWAVGANTWEVAQATVAYAGEMLLALEPSVPYQPSSSPTSKPTAKPTAQPKPKATPTP